MESVGGKECERRGKEHEKGRFLPFQAVVDEIVEGARGKTNERKSERSEYYVEQRRRKRWRASGKSGKERSG